MITTLCYCFTICVMCALLAFQTWVEHLHDLNARYTLEQQPDENTSPFLTLEEQKRLPPSE
mgnify:FL=1